MQTSDPSFAAISLGVSGKGDPLVLRNPVIAAAGCFPLQTRRWTAEDVAPLGAVCTPSIASRTRPGGAGFAISEAPAGVVLHGSFPTVSPRRVREEIGPRWQATGVPLIATVRATDPDECLAVVAALADSEVIAAIELSLVEPAPQSRRAVGLTGVPSLIERLRRIWAGALIVKIFPGIAANSVLLGQFESAGAQAISVGGGFSAMAAGALGSGQPPEHGRLVGPATMPLALRQTAALARASPLPVIAAGGVTMADDVLAYLAVGAAAVQVGSAALRSPLAAVEIARAVEQRIRGRVPAPTPEN